MTPGASRSGRAGAAQSSEIPTCTSQCRPAGRHKLPRVVERRAVPAHSTEVEGQRAVLDDELVGDELLAGAVVAGDHAGDGLGAGVAVADPDADVVADAQPLAPARVVDLDLDGPHREELARLPRPREVLLGVAAEAAGVDRLERLALLARRALVEVERPRPRRAGLVVAVATGQRDRRACEVAPVGLALLDQPRQRTGADAVRRPPARLAVDTAARADRVAVAGFEVGAADPPAHGLTASIPQRPAGGSGLRRDPPDFPARAGTSRAPSTTGAARERSASATVRPRRVRGSSPHRLGTPPTPAAAAPRRARGPDRPAPAPPRRGAAPR